MYACARIFVCATSGMLSMQHIINHPHRRELASNWIEYAFYAQDSVEEVIDQDEDMHMQQ
jgi:hypothetical protein